MYLPTGIPMCRARPWRMAERSSLCVWQWAILKHKSVILSFNVLTDVFGS